MCQDLYGGINKMKFLRFIITIITESALCLIFFCISPNISKNISVEAYSDSKIQKYSEDVEAYIKDSKNHEAIRSVILNDLNEKYVWYNIDSVTIGKPAYIPYYRENTATVDFNERTVFVSGIYLKSRLIGFIYFKWTFNHGKIVPYCTGFEANSNDMFLKSSEKIVLFLSSEKNFSESSAGGPVDSYYITDKDNIRLDSAMYRLDDEYFEKRNFDKLKFSLFSKSSYIFTKEKSGLAEISINYTAPKRFRVSDGNGNYLTLTNNGYCLMPYADESSQLFHFAETNNGKFNVINCRSKGKIKIGKSTSFIIERSECYENSGYLNECPDNIITSIVSDTSYVLTHTDGQIAAKKYRKYITPPISQSWYLETA